MSSATNVDLSMLPDRHRILLEGAADRGPWTTTAGEVTGLDLKQLTRLIALGKLRKHYREVFPRANGLSSRQVDRALTVLKRAQVIEYRDGEWRLTAAGTCGVLG